MIYVTKYMLKFSKYYIFNFLFNNKIFEYKYKLHFYMFAYIYIFIHVQDKIEHKLNKMFAVEIELNSLQKHT